MIILNELIKSSGKFNPKSTYFSFAFNLRNSKSGSYTFYKYGYE